MHRSSQFHLLTFIALVFALCACAPLAGSGQAPPPNLPTATVFAEPVSTKTPYPLKSVPTITAKPEHQGNDEYAYCGADSPGMRILIADTQGVSEDEIAEKMLRLRFDYFSQSQAPAFCRIEEYRIDKISQPEPWMKLEGDSLPPGSFLRVVEFSIKLPQLQDSWISFGGKTQQPEEYSGDAAQESWFQTSIILVIYKMEPFYRMHQVRIVP